MVNKLARRDNNFRWILDSQSNLQGRNLIRLVQLALIRRKGLFLDVAIGISKSCASLLKA